MERLGRKPFQGLINIIRFNWHYYAVACGLIAVVFCLHSRLNPESGRVIKVIACAAAAGVIISLAVSWYVYDVSGLYTLKWLNRLPVTAGMKIVNIHAGFDETSVLLNNKYPDADLTVFDFYDPAKHTEISIERARKVYRPYPCTIRVSTADVPLAPGSADYIFLILSAHEIRNDEERIVFFRQLRHALRNNGRIVVTEHQRDPANLAAYNLGFFHFYSGNTWRHTFEEAGLQEDASFKVTPFISTFILKTNADPS